MFSHTGIDYEKFKDPSTYPQNLILKLERDYFSSSDGDIEQSGVEFDEYFTTSEDLQYGETPASAIRFTLINRDQNMRAVKWGECKAYIGFNSETHDVTLGEGVNSKITANELDLSAEQDGFYIDGVKKYDGECYSILVNSDNIYAFGKDYTVMTNDDGATFTSVDADRFMIAKMQTPKAIIWKENSDGSVVSYINRGAVESEWCYVPMGVYYLSKPKGLNDFTVSVTDALDRMRLFDVDATDFYAHITETYPSDPTIKQWYDELIAWVGVTSGYTASGSTTYNYNPSNVGTLRDLLNYLAEKFRGNFRFDRNGVLRLYRYGSTVVEEIAPYNIEESSLEVAEYSTRAVDKIVVKNLAGLTYVVGSGDNVYPIYGNPFIQDASGLTLANYAFYQYVPVGCVVLEANPCVDVGDKVNVYLSDEEYRVFVDAYNRAYTNENGALFTEENTPLAIPLMHRTMVWNGVCTATYEATGNRVREIPTELEQINYNANTANDTGNIINKIEAHGIEVDCIRGRIDNNGWGINFTNGTMSIGTLAVSNITGTQSLGNNWSIDFDNGTMTIGSISANNITTGTLQSPNGKYSLNMSTGVVTMASANITGGDIDIETASSTSNKIRLIYPENNAMVKSATMYPDKFEVAIEDVDNVNIKVVISAYGTVEIYYDDVLRTRHGYGFSRWYGDDGSYSVANNKGFYIFNSSGTLINSYT